MKRKAIQLANQTLVVSLPSKWVKEQGIKKGDEIDIEERGRELIIGNKGKIEETKKIINIEEFGIMKNRIVLSNYLKGLDELEIRFTKPDQVEEIKNRVINELIGFEIVKQTPNSLILKEIADSSDQSFEIILRRIFLIMMSNSEELLNSLKENKRNLDHIISTDLTINKLCYYCIRILNKRGYKNYREIPMIYSLILTLENIGDVHKNIAKEIIEGKLKLKKEDLENLELSNELICILETNH